MRLQHRPAEGFGGGNTMKRHIALWLLLLTMLPCMAACKGGETGSDAAESYTGFRMSGTYKIVNYFEGGQIYDIQSRGLTDVSIHFNEDGTGVLNGTSGDTAFTYTEDTITTNSKTGDFKLKLQDDKIYVIQTVNGVEHTMVFK